MEVRKLMRRKMLISIALSTILTMSIAACVRSTTDRRKLDLGERYDSERVAMFSSGGTYPGNYLEELHDAYERCLTTTNEMQLIIHEKTAIAIAEAVIKEIYPDKDYQVLYLPTYPKALYYEAENCWEVWLYISSSRSNPVTVYIGIDSGTVKSIIPWH